MSSTTASVQSRRKALMSHRDRMPSLASARELLTFLVEKPVSAVFALWVVCLPALYFALYGDVVESVRTLSFMTVIVVMYVTIMVSGTIAIAFTLSRLASFVERRRWAGRDGREY